MCCSVHRQGLVMCWSWHGLQWICADNGDILDTRWTYHRLVIGMDWAGYFLSMTSVGQGLACASVVLGIGCYGYGPDWTGTRLSMWWAGHELYMFCLAKRNWDALCMDWCGLSMMWSQTKHRLGWARVGLCMCWFGPHTAWYGHGLNVS
jgi:hypothetical protein